MNSKSIVELYHSIKSEAEESLFEQVCDNLIQKFLQRINEIKRKNEWGSIYNAKALSFFVKDIRLDTCEVALLDEYDGISWNGLIGKFDMEYFVPFDEFIVNPDGVLRTFEDYKGNYETFLEGLFSSDPNLTYEDMRLALVKIVNKMKEKGFETFISVTDFDEKIEYVRATLTFSVEV